MLKSCIKVDVAVLGSPSLIVLMVSGRKAILNLPLPELGSCVKVEVAVLGFPSIVCTVSGRKATLNTNLPLPEIRSCVKVEVAILGSPSIIVRTVSVDVKQQ